MKSLLLLLSLIPTLLSAQSKSFCNTDLFGTTTKVELLNGGNGKIIIEENNIKKREGSITWTMTNDDSLIPKF